jgi:amino acid adenylation domain-containing protein
MVTHRNVVRLVKGNWFAPLGPGDTALQFAPASFDASTFEIWGPLLNGARLAVMPSGRASLEELGATLGRYGVTTLWLTAGLFHLIVDTQPAALGGLRRLLAGGDALSPAHVRRALSAHPGLVLVNGYGPTENTTFSCCHEVAGAGVVGRSVPIGRPIANSTAYVLDARLEPAPVGVAGELYVGGDGVARGYLNRPGLTAERFVPDPFSKEPGSRLYRTGDLSRWLPDGTVEFLGRNDYQVKVRGFRVEPGEVEAALGAHPAVGRCVVVAREDASGEKHLVAYAVPRDGRALDGTEMRASLRERLPEYMIPAQFVVLDELPLTPNGKVDRRRLPTPEEASLRGGEKVSAPPSTPEERALAEIWQEVLGVERVGVEDNFFDLGGDSLRSLQIRARAQRRGYDFSIQQLFEHQTIAALARELRPGEPERRDEGRAPFALVSEDDRRRMPAEVEDAYPLAMLQSGMLFHNALDPEAAVYHEVFTFHLRAGFDAEALRAAVGQLVARHPVLRTSFDLTGYGEPLQLVRRECEVPVVVADWRALPAAEQEEALARWIEEDKRRPFDWSRPGLLRFAAFRRGDDTFEFAVSFHHAILDGWSLASLLTELFALYFGQRGEEAPAVEPPPQSTYHDFVALEREAVRSDESRRFWGEALAEGAPSVLPRREAAAGTATRERRVREFRFAPEAVEAWQTFARLAGVPLKSALLAAHLRVLGTLTGDARVTTGLVSNGRPEALDAERVLGMFLNTVPVAFALGGGTWLELARAAAEAEQRLTPHRRFPLAEMQRARGGQPLFEVSFNYTNFHVFETLGGFKHLEVLGGTAFARTNFALAVTFNLEHAPEGARATLHMDYDASALDEELIESAAGYYTRALEAMTREPVGRYETFSPLTEEERRQLLVEWNQTAADYPGPRTLHAMFERQAAETPDAPALDSGADSLTYAELNALASALALRLRRRGVGPGSLVGVMVGRSLETAAALLGILKAGGAYLPLDPAYPRERLSFMLEDARPRVVITQPELAGLLPETEADVLFIGGADEADGGEGGAAVGVGADVASEVSPDDLCYVIYTSGSTGRPKGAMVTHGGAVNCVRWMQHSYALTPADALLVHTPLSFDPSVWELFWPLGVGGRAVVLPPGPFDAAAVAEAVERHRVTTLYVVPSMLRVLLDDAAAVRLRGRLRYVICGGESLPVELARRCVELLGVELHHSYGPTEASIAACEKTFGEGEARARVPIGRPLANTRLYLLDAHLRPVPRGTTGELYIGGVCVGRGYLNRPGLTAERFIPDPFSSEPGGRLYKTGDVVRYLSDGDVEFVGRADSQLKVRGHRIEAGEVESALNDHPGVKESVVLAPEDAGGQRRLVAYLRADVPAPADAELRAHLKTRVPDHMIPSAFVALEEFPLMPNGKVDRRALLSVGLPEQETGAAEPARTPLEELVAGVWATVLGRAEVGRDDEFFALGGDSLLATQAAARLREVCGAEVGVRAIFEWPTVAALAAHLEGVRRSVGTGADDSITPIPRGGALPLSFSQQRQWFIHQLEPESHAYNIPAAVRLRGQLDAAALLRALGEVVARHEPLRTTFDDVGGRPVQVVGPRGRLAAPLVDLAGLPAPAREAHAQGLVVSESRRPFDLQRGPLLRAMLMRLDPEEHVLLLVVHHIAADAWSLGVLIREVVTLYEAFAQGRPSPLAELSVQYADYAAWQRRLLGGDALRPQLDYWRRQLGGALPVLRLPYERTPAAGRGFGGGSLGFRLTPEQTRELKAFGRREGATLFMVLLAAFDALLHHYTEQEDIIVGAPVAGRTRPELEPLIGCFVNMLALRTDMSGDPTFRELLARVREVCLGAYANQDVPFDRLVEVIKADRDPSRSPVFQAAFTLDNTPQQAAEVAGLELGYVEAEPGSTRFNLVLALTDTPHGLAGAFQYNSHLLGAATVGAMAKNFELLLGRLAARPETTLGEVRELLGEAERRQHTLRQQAFGEARRRMLQDAKQRLFTGSAT